ncbi:MAG: methylated-DNA--[protein]-cysteine S-methyltransferase [Pirellulaceae bacterium]
MEIQTFTHTTSMGDIVSSWTLDGLFRISLGPDDQIAADANRLLGKDQDRISDFDQRLQRYFETGTEDFGDVAIDPVGWTPFMSRIYECCRQIRPGETMTYKQLGAAAGNEKASRAVGAAMSRNRVLLVIPCHRVIASNGQLRGFSAPGGLVTKQALLDLEKSDCGQPLLSGC